MSKPITLWKPQLSISSDEACTNIVKYTTSAPRPATPPYEAVQAGRSHTPLTYVPSLQSTCINALSHYPDQLHIIGPTRIRYKPPKNPGDYDLLQELIPAYTGDDDFPDEELLKLTDPRLWATLIQLYDNLPDTLRVYNIPLSDPHVPLLQNIPSTPDFTLVTVLNLSGRSEVHDEAILPLRELHNLAALNLSSTTVSQWGIRKLAKSLVKRAPEDADTRPLAGPWSLRILHLNSCGRIENDVYQHLAQFPLLSVVDLRGTSCTRSSYNSSPFQPSTNPLLFHPTPLLDALAELACDCSASEEPGSVPLYSCSQPYFLNISSLGHKPLRRRPVPSNMVSLPSHLRATPGPTAARETAAETDVVNAAAAAEARRRSSTSATAAFYAPLPQPFLEPSRPRPRLPPLSSLPSFHDTRPTMSRRHRPTFGEVENLGRVKVPPPELMLFRTPPSWSKLSVIQDEARAEGVAAKRSRTKSDELPMTSRTMVESQQAQRSVRAMVALLRQRATEPSSDRPTAPVENHRRKSNPFVRPISDFAEAFRPSPKPPSVAPPPTKKRKVSPCAVAPATPEPQKSKSTLPKFSPNTKPLVSAFSLPIPPKEAFFPELAKAKAREKAKDKERPASTKKSPASTVQTKLSVTVKAEGTPEHDSTRARVTPFAPGSSTKSDSGEFRVTQTTRTPKAEGSAVRKKRKSSGGSAFDWGRWGKS